MDEVKAQGSGAGSIDPKAEYETFKVWAKNWFPHSGPPAATSTTFDAWLASARYRLSQPPEASEVEAVAWRYQFKNEQPVFMAEKRNWAEGHPDWVETPLYRRPSNGE